ncbi:hypothetical protein D9757_009781 [Collybiopsis confluens]|uniref:Pheromone receptor n=1 Tax=Collybiopsis confluens TaxID=2823264 RepID=A0A8H5M5V3_9AGAR|nr:hypothetical protein D9757_009781 [Collybiopsis confluens]
MLASDPTYPLFPVMSFLGFILSIVPLSWHFQAWNSGTCAFMIWTALVCLVTFINSIIWADNAINIAPVWCDISAQLILGASVGIPASTLCISRRLYHITSTQTVSIGRDDKLRAVYSDLAIALGLPLLALILHIIVQPHRFNIIEEYGCSSVTFNTIAAYFLYYSWPVAIGLVSLVYSSLILRTFYVRRLQFNQVIASSGMINPSRYLRLMMLALIDIMCTVPLGVYTIFLSLDGVRLNPWISWEDTHFNFKRVVLVPSVIWRSNPETLTSLQLTRWLPVICSFIFFALFGFAGEARKNYKRAFWFVARRFGFGPASERTAASRRGLWSGLKNFHDNKNSLPVYAPPPRPPLCPAHGNLRKSFLEADSRSTICFPDDDVELGLYNQKPHSNEVPPSPSSASTCSPRTPNIPAAHPPSYIDSLHLDAVALELSNKRMSSKVASFVSLPDITVDDSEPFTPSSYSYPESIISHHVREDDIYISGEYRDSRSYSPVRVSTPLPVTSELPVPPPPVLAFHRPFSPPSVYPVAQPHPALHNAGGRGGGIIITQSSREAF